jgi:hypothetical protein
MIDMHAECERILSEAHKQDVLLRVIGGMAVHFHCPQASRLPALQRDYGDLDFVTASPDDQRMRAFFESIGFAGNARFNALQGASRMIFDSRESDWHIDIFINKFHMCHDIYFSRERLQQDPLTIPLAELLLTKFQIVSINPKDVKDIAALLIEHPLGDSDHETINVQRMLEVTSHDWGFFTTMRINLDKLPRLLEAIQLDGLEKKMVVDKLMELGQKLDEAPKSIGWKLRSVIGRSAPWYEEPEDAARQELKLE